MKLITLSRNDIEMISKIESMGTWEETRYIATTEESFHVYSWNGQYYKVPFNTED